MARSAPQINNGKIGQDRYPWKAGQFSFAACGLREAVLRELQIPLEHVRGRLPRGETAQRVRRWRLGEDCTPEQWAELVALI